MNERELEQAIQILQKDQEQIIDQMTEQTKLLERLVTVCERQKEQISILMSRTNHFES